MFSEFLFSIILIIFSDPVVLSSGMFQVKLLASIAVSFDNSVFVFPIQCSIVTVSSDLLVSQVILNELPVDKFWFNVGAVIVK